MVRHELLPRQYQGAEALRPGLLVEALLRAQRQRHGLELLNHRHAVQLLHGARDVERQVEEPWVVPPVGEGVDEGGVVRMVVRGRQHCRSGPRHWPHPRAPLADDLGAEELLEVRAEDGEVVGIVDLAAVDGVLQ